VCRSAAAAAAAPDRAQEAAIQQLVSARGLDLDPQLVAQEALLTFSFLSSQPGALPHHMRDARQLAAHALRLTDLMATGSTFMTLQMLKRHPGLLSLTPHQVLGCVGGRHPACGSSTTSNSSSSKMGSYTSAVVCCVCCPAQVGERVLQLKLLMPAADVSRLLYQVGRGSARRGGGQLVRFRAAHLDRGVVRASRSHAPRAMLTNPCCLHVWSLCACRSPRCCSLMTCRMWWVLRSTSCTR
jgi:hypothetical protein